MLGVKLLDKEAVFFQWLHETKLVYACLLVLDGMSIDFARTRACAEWLLAER
jgi:hypothetical protein